jgi:hypothetical protein
MGKATSFLWNFSDTFLEVRSALEPFLGRSILFGRGHPHADQEIRIARAAIATDVVMGLESSRLGVRTL